MSTVSQRLQPSQGAPASGFYARAKLLGALPSAEWRWRDPTGVRRTALSARRVGAN